MAREHADKLKLTGVDFEILQALQGGRNLAANIAEMTGRNRKYINNKFPYLEDYGLVTKIGPVENSGLYELTLKGEVVSNLEPEYFDEDVDFDAKLQDELERRRNDTDN